MWILLRRQSKMESASHPVSAASRAAAALVTGNNFHTANAEHDQAKAAQNCPSCMQCGHLPAADRVHYSRSKFLFVSCFSTSVALAGKIAGNARNRPPNTGPYRLAMGPVITVIAPPRKNLTAYSYRLRSLERRNVEFDFHPVLYQNQKPSSYSEYQPNCKPTNYYRCGTNTAS